MENWCVLSKGSWVGGEQWGSARFRRGGIQGCHVEPPPGKRANAAGICPFLGQTLLASAPQYCGRGTGLLPGACGTASGPLTP